MSRANESGSEITNESPLAVQVIHRSVAVADTIWKSFVRKGAMFDEAMESRPPPPKIPTSTPISPTARDVLGAASGAGASAWSCSGAEAIAPALIKSPVGDRRKRCQRKLEEG
eukprot:scaffold45754_cov30-Tisochrysis_lutea.AAC.2